MSKRLSFAASEILEGLHEALQDAKGNSVDKIRQGIIYKKKPKDAQTTKSENGMRRNDRRVN